MRRTGIQTAAHSHSLSFSRSLIFQALAIPPFLLFSSFPPGGAKPSAELLLFSWGCIILALTNYRSMAMRAIKSLCARGGERVKKDNGLQRQGVQGAGVCELLMVVRWGKLVFFLFPFLCLLTAAALELEPPTAAEDGGGEKISKMADKNRVGSHVVIEEKRAMLGKTKEKLTTGQCRWLHWKRAELPPIQKFTYFFFQSHWGPDTGLTGLSAFIQ